MTGSADAIFMFPVRAIRLAETEVLQLGDFGFKVQRLQQILIRLGFYDGAIDGYFCHETEWAIRQAQQHFQLTVTGQYDPETWQVLSQPFP